MVVITGAGSGIGAALAAAFARQGAALALLDIHEERLEAVATALRAGGTRVSTHAVDVGKRSSLEAARARVLAEHRVVDVVVNNAGVSVFGAFEELDEAELRRVLDVNLWGVIHGCHVFLPDLMARPKGHIVNTASMAGVAGMPWQTIYCTSKFAVRGFSASLRAELAGTGVDVTCVLPGTTATGIMDSLGPRHPQVTGALSRLIGHGLSPHRLARKVIRAVRWNRAELFTGPDAWMLDWSFRGAPWLVRGFMGVLGRQARRMLPPAGAGGEHE